MSNRVTISLDSGDINRLEKKLFKTIELIGTKRNRKKVLGPAATVVAKEAEKLSPVGGRRETPRNLKSGRVVYVQGNLKKSAQWLKKLRKDRGVTIGPIYRRGGGGSRRGNRKTNADGYYAHIVYGSPEAYKRRVTGPALARTRNRALAIIERRLAQETKKQGRKLFG